MNRDKLFTLQWSQSSDIMGGYNTPDSMLRDRTSVSTKKSCVTAYRLIILRSTNHQLTALLSAVDNTRDYARVSHSIDSGLTITSIGSLLLFCVCFQTKYGRS